MGCFPTEVSGGALMGLVQGIETVTTCKQELVDSLRRQPTGMALLLVRRIANAGRMTVAQCPVSDLYREILAHPTTPRAVKQMAQPFRQ